MIKRRRRFKQSESLQERLTKFAADARKKAARLPPGPERDREMKKVRQADVALHLDDWASSPGLRPPI